MTLELPHDLTVTNEKAYDAFTPSQPEFPKGKVLEDLNAGVYFRTTIPNTDVEDETRLVVTRFEDDLFCVEAEMHRNSSTPYVNFHERFECDLRRRAKVPFEQGSATRELWKIRTGSDSAPDVSYSPRPEHGGNLEQAEFLRRYNASTFDREATEKYFEALSQRLAKSRRGSRGYQFSQGWVSDLPKDRPLLLGGR